MAVRQTAASASRYKLGRSAKVTTKTSGGEVARLGVVPVAPGHGRRTRVLLSTPGTMLGGVPSGLSLARLCSAWLGS